MNSKLKAAWFAALVLLILIWTFCTFGLKSYVPSVPSGVFSGKISTLPPPGHDGGTDADSGYNRLQNNNTLFETKISHLEQTDPSSPNPSDRPLILYAFFESETARTNLEFFIAHGLHGGADFLFVLNGETDAKDLIPDEPNISYVERENYCFDLGAFAEVLLLDDLYKRYNRFIFLNASVRGPFLPYWANGCWSDMYLGKVTDYVKLVGMTMNCQPFLPPHIQSMLWALDRTALEILLFPSSELIKKFKASIPPHDNASPVPAVKTPGINSCPEGYWEAVTLEVYATPLIRAAGYEVDAMMSAFHGNEQGLEGYEEHCFENGDVVFPGSYYGTDLHPFDTVFTKANRGTGELVMERLTAWTKARKYSSYDHCPS